MKVSVLGCWPLMSPIGLTVGTANAKGSRDVPVGHSQRTPVLLLIPHSINVVSLTRQGRGVQRGEPEG